MKKLEDNTYVDQSDIDGRGVFAAKDMVEGDIACVVNIIPIEKKYGKIPFINMYKFRLGKDYLCICMGNASFFNHSDTPNVRVFAIDTVTFTKTFVVTKDVSMGDELTLYYKIKPKDDM